MITNIQFIILFTRSLVQEKNWLSAVYRLAAKSWDAMVFMCIGSQVVPLSMPVDATSLSCFFMSACYAWLATIPRDYFIIFPKTLRVIHLLCSTVPVL